MCNQEAPIFRFKIRGKANHACPWHSFESINRYNFLVPGGRMATCTLCRLITTDYLYNTM